MSENVTFSYASITEAAKRYRALRDTKDSLEAELKAANREIGYLQDFYFPKIYEDREITKATFDGVGTIYLKADVFVSMIKDEVEGEAPFYDWARNNEPSLISDYIHPARLKAWTKERLEQGLPIPDNTLKASLITKATLLRKG